MVENKDPGKRIIALVLMSFLLLITLLEIFTPTRDFSESENRVLQKMPGFSFESLLKGKFTADYEKYITDQIPLRDWWIGIKSYCEKAIGRKENNGVYLGREGYLLQAFDRVDNINLEKKLEYINSFAGPLEGVNKYFMLVPNSSEILKDKLPAFAPPPLQLGVMSKVREGLQPSIKFVDVYKSLEDAKVENIFYKTDHHWTTKGAYYGYRELVKLMNFIPLEEDCFKVERVSENFYGSLYSKSGFRNVEPDTIELYLPKEELNYEVWYDEKSEYQNSIYNLNNLEKKDKYTVFLDGNHSLVKIKTGSSSGRRLLIIKDSYANSLTPFLTPHYEDIYMIDLRYYNKSVKEFIRDNNIEDVLFLYNVGTFLEEESIKKIEW